MKFPKYDVCVVKIAAAAFALASLVDRPPVLAEFGKAKEPDMVKDADAPRRVNRLAKSISPYLLQHAGNPVDWFEWGSEAFETARRTDKPIFLSIGYAACHWCHVMAHECFEDAAAAQVMNDLFINVKVDREERPDIDEIYMAYTQERTGHGGWPMSVWLTPEGKPFYAGTYFPKDQFVSVLQQIGGLWREDRNRVLEGAVGSDKFFDEWVRTAPSAEGIPPASLIDETARKIARAFDRQRGGMSGGGRNKFPPSMAMELMLRSHRRTQSADLLEAIEVTLDHMARGGIYDHLGGGICRYSTDPEWLVPHFEKMLYDQAMVSSVYLDAYQATGVKEYAATASGILDYVLNDLRSPGGAFFSSRDADSDGLEGAFYVWTIDQVREVLGVEDAKLFCSFYDVSESGNWFESMGHAPKGPKNILRITKPADAFAKLSGINRAELDQRMHTCREKLLAARRLRNAPGLDDKILTAWNGLMIASLAKAARVLDQPRYSSAAQAAAEFILTTMRRDGRLLRSWRNGEARIAGYLEDYAFLIEGLLNLYEATFDRRWLNEALSLSETLHRHFSDPANGAYFFTADDAEKLIARTKSPTDGAIPSGNSVQAMNLLRLAVLLDRKHDRKAAESVFQTFADEVRRSPWSFERHLCALDFYHDRVKEIALVGDWTSPDGQALLRTVYGRYLPNKIVVGAMPTDDDSSAIPLLKGKRGLGGKATAFVCENYSCKLPATTPEKLIEQLKN